MQRFTSMGAPKKKSTIQHEMESTVCNITQSPQDIAAYLLTLLLIVWVENGGIVGRGVLLDYAYWAESQGRTVNPLTTIKIPLSEIKAVAEAQNVTFCPGDILFIRTGYLRACKSFSHIDTNGTGSKTSNGLDCNPTINQEALSLLIQLKQLLQIAIFNSAYKSRLLDTDS